MKKRFLSMLLAVAMALTIVPSTAIAMAVEGTMVNAMATARSIDRNRFFMLYSSSL